MIRGKTQKKIYNDISGAYIPQQNDSLLSFLDNNASDAYKRPWHRIESGLRLNRLRLFANSEAERFQCNENEKTALFQLLRKAHERKQLNTKNIVTYDPEQEKVLEIKGLVFHRTAEGVMTFQIIEKKAGMTRKKRESTPPGEPRNNA